MFAKFRADNAMLFQQLDDVVVFLQYPFPLLGWL